jgi:hypothetical protein
LSVMATQLQVIAEDFDKSGFACEHCKAIRYHNFPQKQMRERVEGAAERLTEILTTLRRRKDDPMFLHGE